MNVRVFVPLVCLSVAAGFAASRQVDAQQAPAPLTAKALQAALAAKPEGAAAEQLAERIRTAFGGTEALKNGAAPLIDQQTVAWAVDSPAMANAPAPPARAGAPAGGGRAGGPRVASDIGAYSVPLTRIGNTTIYAGAQTFTSGTGFTWHYEAGPARFGGGTLEVYETPLDNLPHAGVPKGTVKAMPDWTASKAFPGTTHKWWVYVPAQYNAQNPAALMVFNDGAGNGATQGDPKLYVPTVFDNLIAKGDMPPTVAVFIAWGSLTESGRSNRATEYNTLSPAYSKLVIDELLPEVEKTIKLRHTPENRAIAGMSSGAIAAFTAAWERPDQFSKVVSWVGSFTNQAAGENGRDGGHNYPSLIRRTTPPKNIRVLIQDGAMDSDNNQGNWNQSNYAMVAALRYQGYDVRYEFGQGPHSDKHGIAIFPETLRWLWRDWRDYPKN